MMMEDDFTFPTTVAATAGEAGRLDVDALAHPPPPDVAPPAGAASRLWPFAAPPTAGAAATAPKEAAVAPAPRRGLLAEEERAAAADEEERMDLLWERTAEAPVSRSGGGHAEPPREHRAADAREPTTDERAAAVANQERMDQLWESFNEELLLLRARSKAAAGGGVALRLDPDWYLCDRSPSDPESEETSASSPARPRYAGCAPTMLRASSRAGGAGQFCGGSRSPGSRRRSRSGWALLLRLFRRIFAVDKTASRHHVGIYAP